MVSRTRPSGCGRRQLSWSCCGTSFCQWDQLFRYCAGGYIRLLFSGRSCGNGSPDSGCHRRYVHR